jgi:hypothetical protein
MSWEDIRGNENDGNKTDYFKLEAGQSTIIRIIDEQPVSKWTHWVQSLNRSVPCIGQGCPCCEANKEAKNSGLKQIYGNSKKHSINIINKEGGTPKNQVLEQGKEFFETLLGYREALGDLQKFDLKITRTGTKKNTKYTIIPMQASELTTEEKALLDSKFDLNDKSKSLTREQVLEILAGKNNSTSTGDDEEIEV